MRAITRSPARPRGGCWQRKRNRHGQHHLSTQSTEFLGVDVRYGCVLTLDSQSGTEACKGITGSRLEASQSGGTYFSDTSPQRFRPSADGRSHLPATRIKKTPGVKLRLDLSAEEFAILIQYVGPAARFLDFGAQPVASLSVTFEVAMFELNSGSSWCLRDESNLDLTSLGDIGNEHFEGALDVSVYDDRLSNHGMFFGLLHEEL